MNYTYIPKSLETVPVPEATWWRRYVKELLITLWGLLWVACSIALATYHALDPGLSTTGSGDAPKNLLGAAGAWWADALLFIFGHSSWLLWAFWGVLLVRALLALARPPRVAEAQVLGEQADNPLVVKPRWWPWRSVQQWSVWHKLQKTAGWLLHPPVLPLLGLMLIMPALCALEWSRFYRSEVRLPDNAGGVLGTLVGQRAEMWLGFDGLALVAIVIIIPCLAWVIGFSWWRLADRLGYSIEWLWLSIHRRQQRAEDVRLGEVQAQEREQALASLDPHSDTPSTALASEAQGDTSVEPGDADGVKPTAEDAATKVGLGLPPDLVKRQEPAANGMQVQAAAPLQMSDRAERERQQQLFHVAGSITLPRLDLLEPVPKHSASVSQETLEVTSRLIEKKLKDFGVNVQVQNAAPGPVITRYEIEPATGVKGSTIVGLSRDLARSLSVTSIRVVETIPGKNTMALELPNPKRQTIALSELLGSNVYNSAKSQLTIALGKDIVGQPVVADLAKMPHCLVAGTTGSGKSVAINAMILSLLYKAPPSAVRLLLIDPKMLEMSIYEGIPHLLAPVVTDMSQAGHGLNWCVAEMDRRYKLMSKMGVRNVLGFNEKIANAKAQGLTIDNPFSLTPDQAEPLEHMPYIVVVIDELADLMMVVGKKVEELIARLAQKARAAGIHLILATQRPSVDVITGLIKANIPTRISFQVSSKIDSRTVLDQMGAEALLGMGDMLYLAPGAGVPQRLHGPFASDNEVHNVVNYLKAQGEPNYIEGVLDPPETADDHNIGGRGNGDGGLSGGGEQDPLYDQAVEVVLVSRKASISWVQRQLRVGYNRAATLIESMENAGIVSRAGHNGQREVLVQRAASDNAGMMDDE